MICKKEILLFPFIVLLRILSEIMHRNYFEICWLIIGVQDTLAVTLAHTFLSLSAVPLFTFSSPFLWMAKIQVRGVNIIAVGMGKRPNLFQRDV